jgi:predicted dehydrogenase
MKQTAAVIGLGFVGRAHVDALRRLTIPIRGALESSSERTVGACQLLGIEKVYRSLDELVLCEAIAKSAQDRAWVSL